MHTANEDDSSQRSSIWNSVTFHFNVKLGIGQNKADWDASSRSGKYTLPPSCPRPIWTLNSLLA